MNAWERTKLRAMLGTGTEIIDLRLIVYQLLDDLLKAETEWNRLKGIIERTNAALWPGPASHRVTNARSILAEATAPKQEG